MQSQFSDSQLAATTSEKAWYLLSLLLSTGGPTTPLDLASRCTLFEVTTDLIRFLCSIPNSPITLANNESKNDDVLVTVSTFGFLTLKNFLSNFNFKFVDSRVGLSVYAAGSRVGNDVRVYFRKRKRIETDTGVDNTDMTVSILPKRFRNDCSKVQFYITEGMGRSGNCCPVQLSFKPVDHFLIPDLFGRSLADVCRTNIIPMTDEMDMNVIIPRKEQKRIMPCEHNEEIASFNELLGNQAKQEENGVEEIDLNKKLDFDDEFYFCQQHVETVSVSPGNCATNDCHDNPMSLISRVEDNNLVAFASLQREAENSFQAVNIGCSYSTEERCYEKLNESKSINVEQTANNLPNQTTDPTKLSVSSKLLPRPSSMLKMIMKDEGTLKEIEKHARDQKKVSVAQRSKQKKINTCTKEQRKEEPSISHKNSVKHKDLPCFDSYMVEEEEGSGGYGTVYRARRKDDGTIVAIKCPHADAQKHHVKNEQRMLERFGGKNFIIKYDGCLKSGDLDCFVLEYVAHDRPEVLKREIDVFHLRWYSYCMFRALASLHKHRIAHRDVKPGNFLFSRKLMKGYLIDFNLALDLHQKNGKTSKLKAEKNSSSLTLPKAKCFPLAKSGRHTSVKPFDTVKEPTKNSKSNLDTKILKKKIVDQSMGHDGWNIMKSQGAEGSGVTSVKDGTSGRTPSVERKRVPLLYRGRKEILNLAREAIESHNHEVVSVPAPMRKRVSAPLGKLDRIPYDPTPMPCSTKVGVVGVVGITGNKGDSRSKREGPCVGTKGFRAPEVLFRSFHQGLKVDIWSAGVTLLYLIIGRSPFYGDPEQNIRDIVKLRGSEDVWEVSKLHDREPSFPEDLYDTQTYPSRTLYEWCKMNTKRRDFLDEVPSSLIDLVDKCLTVNPRLRISAEDALKHEFFDPCHEDQRKQRALHSSYGQT